VRAHLAKREHIRYIVMRVLLTGVSGTGKSSLVREIRNRGYTAFDADDDGLTEPRPDGAWGWRVDLVRALFDQHDDDLLFFAGCSDEQAQFEFDFKVLLTAPVEVVLERLRTRSTNSFGKSQDQRDRVLDDIAWVVPLLRDSADLVVETISTVSKVADVVVDAVAERRRRAPS
jgi:dephospho-CoA kinase